MTILFPNPPESSTGVALLFLPPSSALALALSSSLSLSLSLTHTRTHSFSLFLPPSLSHAFSHTVSLSFSLSVPPFIRVRLSRFFSLFASRNVGQMDRDGRQRERRRRWSVERPVRAAIIAGGRRRAPGSTFHENFSCYRSLSWSRGYARGGCSLAGL